ncbi:hypothetical protein PILCRDRAFT_99322 [Piloderma croceum F 1598]|uniref:NAD(P)-binding protein n=1 Tax=Piloderma croceum (strain F 1598) TaxID=765440 RepID=A0A0C3AHZ6_PILCF|nr:hypothetical protein PILCRDRAFT_99322 [Piloderma croceum F 1598]
MVRKEAKFLIPSGPRFTVDDIPDLTGRVIIALLFHNAKVYVAARNQAKAEAAIKRLRENTGRDGILLKLDLADLKSTKTAAEEFLSKEHELHVLFNNGGVLGPPIHQLTADGYDLQFGTNDIFDGHFMAFSLYEIPLPALLAAANSSPGVGGRVVNTSSIGHQLQNLDFSTFRDGPSRKKMGTWNLYFQSKYGNVVFATELARRYGDRGIVSTSVHPGATKTDIFLNDPSYGALPQLWAGTSPEGKDLNGKRSFGWGRSTRKQVVPARKDSQDPATCNKLWMWLEERVEGI